MQTDSGIVDDLIRREGSTYTDHPSDPGGATKFGITLKTLRKYRNDPKLTATHVKALTQDEARLIYRRMYIVEPGYVGLHDSDVRALLVDSAVQHGQGDATRFLQRALLRHVADIDTFKVDGVCGSQTIALANGVGLQSDLYFDIVAERCVYYGKLITETPSLAVFAHGWANRLAEFIRRPVL